MVLDGNDPRGGTLDDRRATERDAATDKDDNSSITGACVRAYVHLCPSVPHGARRLCTGTPPALISLYTTNPTSVSFAGVFGCLISPSISANWPLRRGDICIINRRPPPNNANPRQRSARAVAAKPRTIIHELAATISVFVCVASLHIVIYILLLLFNSSCNAFTRKSTEFAYKMKNRPWKLHHKVTVQS